MGSIRILKRLLPTKLPKAKSTAPILRAEIVTAASGKDVVYINGEAKFIKYSFITLGKSIKAPNNPKALPKVPKIISDTP